MTRNELLAAVPVREFHGRPVYIDVNDIPQPWRDQFKKETVGCGIPVIDGVERAAWAWDWKSWVNGSWWV
jgi:hypothetical protein